MDSRADAAAAVAHAAEAVFADAAVALAGLEAAAAAAAAAATAAAHALPGARSRARDAFGVLRRAEAALAAAGDGDFTATYVRNECLCGFSRAAAAYARAVFVAEDADRSAEAARLAAEVARADLARSAEAHRAARGYSEEVRGAVGMAQSAGAVGMA